MYDFITLLPTASAVLSSAAIMVYGGAAVATVAISTEAKRVGLEDAYLTEGEEAVGEAVLCLSAEEEFFEEELIMVRPMTTSHPDGLIPMRKGLPLLTMTLTTSSDELEESAPLVKRMVEGITDIFGCPDPVGFWKSQGLSLA